MTAPRLQPLYTVEQIAERYGVSTRTAHRICNEAGRILVGNRYMVPEDRLLAWEQRNTFAVDAEVESAASSGPATGLDMYGELDDVTGLPRRWGGA